MYYKLALRNARRSGFDYLLYMFTMTVLVAILCVSNCLAAVGELQAGFQTAALPLLIGLIMVVLAGYINAFMLKQRAKELATYLLLGMEKSELSLLFLLELGVIGAVCFIVGVLLGQGVYQACFRSAGSASRAVLGKSAAQTLAVFCLVEGSAALWVRQTLYKLQIGRLMKEKSRNQPLNARGKTLWRGAFLVSFLGLLGTLCGIVFLPAEASAPAISLVAVPLCGCVFAFYKWLYASFSAWRLSGAQALYRGNQLYQLAELTTGARTGAGMNAVFCVCLLFAAMSFAFGTLLLRDGLALFSPPNQQWMGFLQISICIIFMVIYFSILSLLQIVELRRQGARFRILYYMGKTPEELKALLCSQILIKLLLPTLMCFVVLGVAVPLLNHKLNGVLPTAMQNWLPGASGAFTACFAALYLAYFAVVYTVSSRYMNEALWRGA